MLADALDKATEKVLAEGKSPSRKVGEIDNRGSHFWLAKFWVDALAAQDEDAEMKEYFTPLAEKLGEVAEQVDKDLIDNQGSEVDLGGYFLPDDAKASAVMRPSEAFNAVLDALSDK